MAKSPSNQSIDLFEGVSSKHDILDISGHFVTFGDLSDVITFPTKCGIHVVAICP